MKGATKAQRNEGIPVTLVYINTLVPRIQRSVPLYWLFIVVYNFIIQLLLFDNLIELQG